MTVPVNAEFPFRFRQLTAILVSGLYPADSSCVHGQEFGMKRRGIVLVLGILTGSYALQAQTPSIPFNEIERESRPQLQRASELVAASTAEGFSSSSIPAAAIVNSRPTPPAVPPIADRNFYLLNGLHLGMALFDIGMTQHCIAIHQCKEGNPLMPSSMTGQLGITLGLFAYSTGGSYYLKRHHAKPWWAPPVTGILTHTIGVASALAR